MITIVASIVFFAMLVGSMVLTIRHWDDAEEFAKDASSAFARFWPIKVGRAARMGPSFVLGAVGLLLVLPMGIVLEQSEQGGRFEADLDLESVGGKAVLALALLGFLVMFIAGVLQISTGWWGRPRKLLFPFLRDKEIPWLDEEEPTSGLVKDAAAWIRGIGKAGK